MKELGKYIENNSKEIENRMVKSFKEFFVRCRDKRVEYIVLSILRTSLLEGKGMCLISGYDENWYLDMNPVEGKFDSGFIFSFFHEYAEIIDKERKKYIGKITYGDIEKIKRERFMDYAGFLYAIFNNSMESIMELEELEKSNISETVQMRIGEYMDETEMVEIEQIKLESTSMDYGNIEIL